MIRKGDVQWWVLEARKYPESAPIAIEFLAERLAELDRENEELRDDVIRLQQRAPVQTSSDQVIALRRQVEKLQYLLKSQTATEPAIVLLSDQLRTARIPISEVQKLVRTGEVLLTSRAMLDMQCMLAARPHDELLAFTNEGRGLRQLVPDLPPLTESRRWPNERNPALSEHEQLSVSISVSETPRFWTLATRKGYVQRFVRAALEREMSRGDPLLRSLIEHDEAVAIVDGDRGDIVLVTRWGQAIRFSQRVIDVQGSIALELEEGDEVAAALALPEDGEILIVTASGYAARRSTAHLPARAKPGGTTGKRLIQAQDVLAVYPFTPHDHLLYLTYSGTPALVPTADIPLLERLGRGTRIHDLRRDPAAAVALIPQDLL
jgi:DNA gyrase/topoisomerase IV subunit A